MSDNYDDGMPRSSFSLASYMLGRWQLQGQQEHEGLVDRLTGRAPVARQNYDALVAQYESVVDYANQLVQQVEQLQQQNATMNQAHQRLQQWAAQARAKHAEDDQACRQLARTANAQTAQISGLHETIEDLQMEIERLKGRSIRTD
jgi:DNA repair ATPase RecN